MRSLLNDTTVNLQKIQQLETNVVDMSIDDFGKELSNCTIPELDIMVDNVQGKHWLDIKHPNIRKMRLIMELKYIYFPDQAKKNTRAKKNPWKGISTENLMNVVQTHNLKYAPSFHEGIRRMRLIMALKSADITPESIKGGDVQ